MYSLWLLKTTFFTSLILYQLFTFTSIRHVKSDLKRALFIYLFLLILKQRHLLKRIIIVRIISRRNNSWFIRLCLIYVMFTYFPLFAVGADCQVAVQNAWDDSFSWSSSSLDCIMVQWLFKECSKASRSFCSPCKGSTDWRKMCHLAHHGLIQLRKPP